MRRLAVLFAMSSVLVPIAVRATPASAYDVANSPEIRAMDSKIDAALSEVDRWNRRLAEWQVEIATASALVQRLTYAEGSSASSTGSLDVLRRGVRRTDVLAYRLARSHVDLQRLLHDPEARNAQQQVAAWATYADQLTAARDRMIRRANRRFSFVPGKPVTYEAWASGFLDRLGAPTCEENLMLVVAWQTSESTAAAFNPLATTHAMEGATDMNSVGVKNYVSLGQGLDAAAETLTSGVEAYGYGPIVDSLRACAPAEITASVINASAWCRDCTGGMYLTGLLPIVRASYPDHAARVIATSPA